MNPRKVDNPTIQPYRCLFCTAGHKGGPVIDMLVDVLEGRAYICLAHAKRIAIAAGFAEGEEMEKLANAGVLLAEAEKGLKHEQEIRATLEISVADLAQACERVAGERDQARQQLAFAEAKLAELGQGIGATLAAVGAPERVSVIAAPQSGQYVAEPILDDEGRFNERHEPPSVGAPDNSAEHIALYKKAAEQLTEETDDGA